MRVLLLLPFLFSLPAFAADPAGLAAPAGLPPLGQWLLDANGKVAHWLGFRHEGKELQEPVNVVLILRRPTAGEAERDLLAALERAGFGPRRGHSTGYQARLGGQLLPQLPREEDHAFSDAFYLQANNHGRIFGPVAHDGAFVFIGAFSREDVNLVGKIRDPNTLLHPYLSFSVAREAFAKALRERAGARSLGTVPMGNAVAMDSAGETTGDHDGSAALLEL